MPTDLPLDVWIDSYADYGVSPAYDQPTPKELLRRKWLASAAGRRASFPTGVAAIVSDSACPCSRAARFWISAFRAMCLVASTRADSP